MQSGIIDRRIYRYQLIAIACMVLAIIDMFSPSVIPVMVVLLVPLHSILVILSISNLFRWEKELTIKLAPDTRNIAFLHVIITLIYYTIFRFDPAGDIANFCGCGSKGDQNISDSGEYYWGMGPVILSFLNFLKFMSIYNNRSNVD